MKIVEYETATRSFTFLKRGDLYRESLGGTIYLKIFPVTDRHGNNWNCVNLASNQLDFTFEDTDVFPVEGTLVENYKG